MSPTVPDRRQAFCLHTTMEMLTAYAVHDRIAWDQAWQQINDEFARRLVAFHLWTLLTGSPDPDRRHRVIARRLRRPGNDPAALAVQSRYDAIAVIAAFHHLRRGDAEDQWRTVWSAVRDRPDVIWELTAMAYDAW